MRKRGAATFDFGVGIRITEDMLPAMPDLEGIKTKEKLKGILVVEEDGIAVHIMWVPDGYLVTFEGFDTTTADAAKLVKALVKVLYALIKQDLLPLHGRVTWAEVREALKQKFVVFENPARGPNVWTLTGKK